jgi:cell shape-determining protein MreC
MPVPTTQTKRTLIDNYQFLASVATKLLDDLLQMAKRYRLQIVQLTSDNQKLRTALNEKQINDRSIELLTRENDMLREQLLSCREQLNLDNGKAVAN